MNPERIGMINRAVRRGQMLYITRKTERGFDGLAIKRIRSDGVRFWADGYPKNNPEVLSTWSVDEDEVMALSERAIAGNREREQWKREGGSGLRRQSPGKG